MESTALKTDKIGMVASSLCMVHCIATPFLFIASSSAAMHTDTSPEWWHWMDYLFLLISFFAVWQTRLLSTIVRCIRREFSRFSDNALICFQMIPQTFDEWKNGVPLSVSQSATD